MAKAETLSRSNSNLDSLNVDVMRSLVKQYSELGQWTSALFWADAAAATSGSNGVVSGDDIWLLASAMLAQGEYHRAANAVTSRDLHRCHLLCLGVAMRAYLAAKEPAVALNLMEECDPQLLEPLPNDQTHNRALAAVLVWQAKALNGVERREAGARALQAALRADVASYEALALLLSQRALSPQQEAALVASLPIARQLGGAEGALLQAAYSDLLDRYSPPADNNNSITEIEKVRSRTLQAAACQASRLAAACQWKDALKVLDSVDGWCSPSLRAACLVELKRPAQLFALAHSLVDAYSQRWEPWFAVACYYYLIGKSEFARRYLSKAKSIEPGAGCVWLLYGHSFASDGEHDQAMAAYFKASQLMPGCHLPPLYVGVECSLLNNVSMCSRFLLRAAALHSRQECEAGSPEGGEAGEAGEAGAAGDENGALWARVCAAAGCAGVAHEAGVAALRAGHPRAAYQLLTRAQELAEAQGPQLNMKWAATLDALAHASRKLGRAHEALQWHSRALALRPNRAQTYAGMGLCLALLGRPAEAGDALHAALARDPDDAVAPILLDAVLDTLDKQINEEEIPQFPFPAVNISIPPPATPQAAPGETTNISDMSMSFD